MDKHENNAKHREALLAFLTRQRKNTLDSQISQQIEKERDYWIQVLKRVLAVIRTLAKRGLAFRGSDEKFGSPSCGNYISLLELVAEFDPFLKNHIEQYGNSGSGKTSYLSKTTCHEFITIMANKIRELILDDIKKAEYFGLSVDSTPDLSNVDQLTIIIRYVSPDDGEPVERFLAFLAIKSHTGRELATKVLNYLEKQNVDFDLCRGQSYDNAANMTGRYNGMQAKLREENEFAVFVPCSGHSLNLVGRAAVDSCLEAVNFFDIVQKLYVFYMILHIGGTY